MYAPRVVWLIVNQAIGLTATGAQRGRTTCLDIRVAAIPQMETTVIGVMTIAPLMAIILTRRVETRTTERTPTTYSLDLRGGLLAPFPTCILVALIIACFDGGV